MESVKHSLTSLPKTHIHLISAVMLVLSFDISRERSEWSDATAELYWNILCLVGF